MADKIEVEPGVFVTPNSTASNSIGIDGSVKYEKKVYAEPKKDTGGITYSGPEVDADQPWLLRLEQGAATFFDNINGLFNGGLAAVNAFAAFVKNYWQILIIAGVALIVIDRK